MKKIFILFLGLSFLAGKLFPQDFHLSQYEDAPLNLNPAMTGMFAGKYRLHSHYRSQWATIATKPFLTTAVSGELNFKKVSGGVEIIDQRAGAGGYNVFGFQVSGALDRALGKSRRHRISFGLQGGLIHKSVNIAKLLFESQYTTGNGGGFDNSLSNEEFGFDQSVLMPDLNAGLVYYYAKSPARFNPFIGIAAFHLTRSKESFFGSDNIFPMRYLVHAGCKIVISEMIQLQPRVMYMQQVNNKEMVAGMDINFFMKDVDAYLILGASYRDVDAIIPVVALKYGNFTYKVSYDLNNSSLRPHTGGRGGFELSITMLGSKKKSPPVPECPRQ